MEDIHFATVSIIYLDSGQLTYHACNVDKYCYYCGNEQYQIKKFNFNLPSIPGIFASDPDDIHILNICDKCYDLMMDYVFETLHIKWINIDKKMCDNNYEWYKTHNYEYFTLQCPKIIEKIMNISDSLDFEFELTKDK